MPPPCAFIGRKNGRSSAPALADNATSMRVRIEGGKITAEAESASDITALLAFSKTREPKAEKAEHRGKSRARKCRVCGKQYRYPKAHKRSCATPVQVERVA